MRKMEEVEIYTAENSSIAQMLVEKLKNEGIPARVGSESAAAGVFGVPEEGRTIIVPSKLAKRAKDILKM